MITVYGIGTIFKCIHRQPFITTIGGSMKNLVLGILLMLTVGVSAHAAPKVELKVGDVPPDFIGTTLGGDKLYVSDFKGKILVVTFWASWCAPCRKELPIVNYLQSQIPAEEFVAVGVNWKEGNSAIKHVVNALGEDLAMLFTRDKRGKIGRTYGLNGIPHMFIIHPDGHIAAIHRGYSQQAVQAIADELTALVNNTRRKRRAAAELD